MALHDDDLVAWLNSLDDAQRKILAHHFDMETFTQRGKTREDLIEAALEVLRSHETQSDDKLN